MTRFLALVFFFASTSRAVAFPEMVRHNYVNCTACHVSPSGGGLMTAYGRSLSKELLSRWSYENEETLLHGLLNTEKKREWVDGSRKVGFNVGGDIRYLQLHMENNAVKEGRWIPMQRDLEAAFNANRFTIVGSYGLQEIANEDEWESRRYYAMYQVTDNLSVRAGHFIPIFGLAVPDHTVATRRGLGFDQGQERDSAEINYIWESWNATVTYTQSPQSFVADALEEAAGSVQLNYAFLDKYKVGVSYWNGSSDARKRDILGLHVIWGFTPEIYALSEVDYQWIRPANGVEQEGLFILQKFGWEFTRGIHAVVLLDNSHSNLSVERTNAFSYGAGFLFYPRPHFEFQGLWTQTVVKAIQDDPMDVGYLMVHYYF